MKVRKFNRNSEKDIQLLEQLCKNSGSESCKKHKSIIRCMLFYTKDKPQNLLCEIIDDCAFYMSIKGKSHVRGVYTIVRNDKHGCGYGKMLNQLRYAKMKEAGIDTFRFRTNQNEPALKFWLKQGAKIVDINGNDYEMEIKYNK